MKIRKVLLGSVLALGLTFFVAGKVMANEGVFRLAGQSEADGRCFGLSVYIDGSYKVVMTCRGLSMALDPVINKYVVWVNETGDKKFRLGEIVSGKLQSNVPDKFSSVFVTLEADAFPNKPSANMILSGSLEAIDFGKGYTAPTVTPTQIAQNQQGTVTPTPSAASAAAATGKLTSVVVGIGKAILFGFILLLIVVGVMSFLARRKNL